MAQKVKKLLRRTLTFFALMALVIVCLILIRYVISYILELFGGEESVGWQPILLICVVLSVVLIVVDITLSRRGIKGRGREAVVACRSVMLTSTIMFGVFLLLDMDATSSEDADAHFRTAHWLSLSLSISIFNYLYARMQQREVENDVNGLVVAAECQDIESAEALSAKLEGCGIKAMIVEKGSPIYINGGEAPVQLQVCRKDLEMAKEHIAQ